MSLDYSSNEQKSQGNWAAPTRSMHVREVPHGALNINIDGRDLSSPLKGFGQLWRKTFRIRLVGLDISPEEVVATWKQHFPEFQPPENHFYPTMSGIRPGEVLFIDGKVPPLPGLPPILPVASGVMVMFTDDTSFSIVTPEGFPEAGFNTWSAYRDDDGIIVAQVQTFARSADPLYEIFHRFLGSSRQQDHVWTHVLESLATYLGVKGNVTISKELIDSSIQWAGVKNIWKNAAIRTVVYFGLTPLRRAGRAFRREKPKKDTGIDDVTQLSDE